MSKGIDKIQEDNLSVDSLCNFSWQNNFMEPGEFRKLGVHLPRQPLVNQRPWWIAGFVLVFIILVIAAMSYYTYKKHTSAPYKQEKIHS